MWPMSWAHVGETLVSVVGCLFSFLIFFSSLHLLLCWPYIFLFCILVSLVTWGEPSGGRCNFNLTTLYFFYTVIKLIYTTITTICFCSAVFLKKRANCIKSKLQHLCFEFYVTIKHVLFIRLNSKLFGMWIIFCKIERLQKKLAKSSCVATTPH
jgi:hypothetical protein